MKEVFTYIILLISITFTIQVHASDNYETVSQINFCPDSNSDEAGWVSVYGNNSFPVDLGNGITLSANGAILSGGPFGEPSTIYPEKVGSTFNTISNTDNGTTTLTLSGLTPGNQYRIEIFSSRQGDPAGDVRTTSFFALDHGKANDGEFLIFDQAYTYTTGLHGFKWWNIGDVEDAPSDWKHPYDYEKGEVYERYEVISQPTNRPVKFQFGFWQDNGTRESLSSQVLVNGPGAVTERHSSPATWWELDGSKPLDFSRPADFLHLGIPMWSDSTRLVSDWVSDSDWEYRADYLPMTIRATIVGVAYGSQFSGWTKWAGTKLGINPVGNTDSLLVFPALTPDESGDIEITMSKLDGQYGYINAMVIKQSTVSELKIDIVGSGTVSPPAGTYDKHTPLTLTATPEQGWVFDGWEGDTVSNEPSITIDMAQDKYLIANFRFMLPEGILARINFTYNESTLEQGWINILGDWDFPVDLGAGVSMELDGEIAGGPFGEPASIFPANVGGTFNAIEPDYETTLAFTIKGLEPSQKYILDIFCSRDDNIVSNRTTYFVAGGDTIAIDPIGNTDELATFTGLEPDASGEIEWSMYKTPGQYGYINAMLIRVDDGTSSKQVDTANRIIAYPVPAKELLTLDNLPANCTISVLNMAGSKVLNHTNGLNDKLQVDISGLHSGMYLVQVGREGSIIGNLKILKQ